RRILENNSEILSKNGYIKMCEKLYEDNKVHSHPTNYIYCSICDSLVFISENGFGGLSTTYRDNHLKRCISGNSISNEHAKRKDIFQSIDKREFHIWQYKQFILQEETKINYLHLELFSQSTSHSEKDKLASISYNDNTRTISYEAYKQVKITMAENTMPSAPNFEPAYISPARQEMISPTSYQSSNWPRGAMHRRNTGKLFISSLYVKQPKGTVLRLGDGTEIM
ncbi:4609_t:CDS:1, partial [Cetraspora pellucida]